MPVPGHGRQVPLLNGGFVLAAWHRDCGPKRPSDGDTLTMCVGPPKGARPDRFESSQDDRNTIYVLKRVKK